MKRIPISLLFLTALALAAPAFALDDIYLVRHAEKYAAWPADRDLDTLQPLSADGLKRAEALAARLKGAGIAAVYTSRTTRAIETGAPLAHALEIPVVADDASTRPAEMTAFLDHLKEKHAGDRAILIVGHSNTVPELLAHLGAKGDCFARLGITGEPGSLLVEGYDGVWKADLKKPGCEALSREAAASPKP